MAANNILYEIADLMKNHQGKKNAISSKEIGKMFNLRQEDTHAQARELIRQVIVNFDLPIIGGGKGYYLAKTKKELDDYITSLDSRIAKMLERKRIVSNAFKKLYPVKE